MDEAARTHPEMALRCADCGYSWRARAALYCLRCGGAELASYDPNWKPPQPTQAGG